jgi:hypothetical protein
MLGADGDFRFLFMQASGAHLTADLSLAKRMMAGEEAVWEARRLIDVEGYAQGSPAAACFVGLRSLKRMIRPQVGLVSEADVGQG